MNRTPSRLFIGLMPAMIFLCVTSVSCVQKMGKTGHVRPLEGKREFLRYSRQPPEGTVPQSGEIWEAPATHVAVTKAELMKGRELFNAYCAPCHGFAGYGDGMIVQRGFLAPPSYHQDRLRNAPDRHFYDVITNGFGAMYSYADRVRPQDRWAIVAYIRALQLSQNVKKKSLTTAEMEKLAREEAPEVNP